MYVVGNWVKRNMGNISFSDCYISPREEKNSKPIPVENIVPHKRISRVNPNGGNIEVSPRRNIQELQIQKTNRAGAKQN